MTKVYCNIEQCKHRSKKPVKDTEWHVCKLKHITIGEHTSDCSHVTGNPTYCIQCTHKHTYVVEDDY